LPFDGHVRARVARFVDFEIERVSAIYLRGLIEAAGDSSEKDIARPVHF
jgi:hypothetical protein